MRASIVGVIWLFSIQGKVQRPPWKQKRCLHCLQSGHALSLHPPLGVFASSRSFVPSQGNFSHKHNHDSERWVENPPQLMLACTTCHQIVLCDIFIVTLPRRSSKWAPGRPRTWRWQAAEVSKHDSPTPGEFVSFCALEFFLKIHWLAHRAPQSHCQKASGSF